MVRSLGTIIVTAVLVSAGWIFYYNIRSAPEVSLAGQSEVPGSNMRGLFRLARLSRSSWQRCEGWLETETALHAETRGEAAERIGDG